MGCLPLLTLANISSIFPRSVSPRSCSQAEEGSLLWQTSQETQGDSGLPQGGTSGEAYSDYLRAAREAKKEDSIELAWSPRPHQQMASLRQESLASFH